MILNPLFDEKELIKERQVIFEEMKMRKDMPNIFVVDKMRNKGIGKALMNHVQKSFPDTHLLTGYGIEGTNIFFEKCKH
jgi:GNAT superfamily N-acetyltransferase